MNKVIHYCWFGGNPLPKMAKKCIESWKKYLPDFEIKQWDETNFDINVCPFVKEAYENKKWAFVSDYARIYALYNEGGIYFDTDLEVLRNIDDLLKDDFFMGYEDEEFFSTAIMWIKNKQNKYAEQILNYYNNLEGFDPEANIWQYANPKIITNIIKKLPKRIQENGVEVYDEKIKIYPVDYFNPINYDYSEKRYTENTYAVHYFNATWTPKGERVAISLYRTFGSKKAKVILNILYFFSRQKHRLINFTKRTINKIYMFLSIHINKNKRVNKIKQELQKQKEPYLAICHPEWIGVRNATKSIFKDEMIELREQYTEKEAEKMAQAIVEAGKEMVVFNAFAKGWDNIAKHIKQINKNVKIKVIMHGSHALLSEEYDWNVFNTIFGLYKKGIIDEIATVKKSLYEFYKAKGINTYFIMNTVNIDNKENYTKKESKSDDTKVGLYVSGDRWVKNVYNQVSAASLMENAILDCLPLNDKIVELAQHFKLKITGKYENITREEMFKRIAKNDINLYVTFTECSPLIPLESLELGVPCITGDNHHYFEGTELEKYLVVNKEDNIMNIYEKMKYALENREYILDLYKKWKKKYDEEVANNRNEFLKI